MTIIEPRLTTLPVIDTQYGSDPGLLHDELLAIIRAGGHDHPRQRQVALGPSEVGTPCARKLGHKLAGTTPVNQLATHGDAWRSTIGVAIHAWLAERFALANVGQPVARWLIEQRVGAGQYTLSDGTLAWLDGTCDVFDRVTATVIDWKTCTVKKIASYRANGPGEQYRVQAHCYGAGWIDRGLDVQRVALTFLPRDGSLTQAWTWTEDYDPQVAADALTRIGATSDALRLLGPDIALAGLGTAEDYCTYCPYYNPAATDYARACPGHGKPLHISGTATAAQSAQLAGLISAPKIAPDTTGKATP